MIRLPYGRTAYELDLVGRPVRVVALPALPPSPQLAEQLDSALGVPIASPRLETLVAPGARVTLIVSDATRVEPRRAFIRAIRSRLGAMRWTIAIATGTHGPCGPDATSKLGIAGELTGDVALVDHDGHVDRDMVLLGSTTRGTPVRVHRCIVDTDLVVATGCIRPHYFAGFGAGVKAVFPGLGGAREIRVNHRLKQDARARAGVVDDNPCRDDLEEAVGLVAAPVFLLNGVCGPDGRVRRAVAGHAVRAFRAGVELARPWFTVHARPAAIVVASDATPVTDSLYQAAKIAAAAAPLVEAGGVLVVVAECRLGIGPLATVNEEIFDLGIRPRLRPDVRVVLVSSLAPEVVRTTRFDYAPSVSAAVEGRAGEVVVMPMASQMIMETTE